MKFKINVQLKKEILDPEARAIHRALIKNGFSSLRNISVSKNFHLELEDDTDESLKKVEDVTQKYLSNPLSETYTIKKVES